MIERPLQHITWDPILAEKGGFKHFMQKEIFEQPRAVRDTLLGLVSLETGRLFLEEIGISEADLRELTSVRIVGCGTSWHAGLAGQFLIEDLAREALRAAGIPAESKPEMFRFGELNVGRVRRILERDTADEPLPPPGKAALCMKRRGDRCG